MESGGVFAGFVATVCAYSGRARRPDFTPFRTHGYGMLRDGHHVKLTSFIHNKLALMKFAMLALSLLISSYATAQERFATVPEEELQVGGVKIGHKEEALIAKLGRPLRIESNEEGIVFYYSGLEVWLGADKTGVFDVKSTSEKFCTPRGICPGTAVARLNATYGPPMVASRAEGHFLEYHGKGTTCWFQIAAKREVIRSIRIACQP